MLKVTTKTDETRTILVLEGRLAGPWVQVLEGSWRQVADAGRRLRIEVCAVNFVDEAGKALLSEMHRCGAEIVAEGCMNKAIVKEITEGGGS